MPCDLCIVRSVVALISVSALLMSGCQHASHTQSGALVGSGLGAFTGAVVGAGSGHAEGGALIGAAAGALAGGLVGNAEDAREERDAAIAQAHFAEQARQALTNTDLVRLTQSGVTDEVILSTVRARGGRFDLSPDAIIQLKQNGVSDRVIIELQQTMPPTAPGPILPVSGSATYVTPSPRVVIVEPEPQIDVGVLVGPRPLRRRPRLHGPRWHLHGHVEHCW